MAKTLEVYARSGLTQLGFADPDGAPRGGGLKPGHLPADPRPPGPRAGGAARGVLAGRARGRATRAPDRDVRDAPDGARARAAEGVLVRRGLAAAGRPGGAPAAGVAAAHGPLGAGGADHQHAARHRRAGGRAQLAGEPARRDVRLRDALGGRGGAGARAARPRSRGQRAARGAARASRRDAACFATTAGASRRSRWRWSCRRCCAPSRRHPAGWGAG